MAAIQRSFPSAVI